MHQAPGEVVQKVCPHCAALAVTGDSRCPWCGKGYRRRLWPALLATGLATAAVTLGGTAYLLTVAGEELDQTLDSQVRRVERDLDRSLRGIQRGVRTELDRRLPAASP